MLDEVRERIGIDIDGVLYDWDGAARDILRGLGHELSAHSSHWNHIEDEVGKEAWKRLWQGDLRRELFEVGRVYPQALEAVRFLQRGYDIAFITSRPRDVTDITLRWLAGLKLRPWAVFHVGTTSKAGIVDAVAFIEDREENAHELKDAHPEAVVFAPDRPWNTKTRDDIVKFADWQEVVKWAKQRKTRTRR